MIRAVAKRILPGPAVQLLKFCYRGCGLLDRKIAKRYLAQHREPKLQIGCGNNALPGWLNTNYPSVSRDIMHLDATRPFPFDNETFDYVFGEHMIEHVPYHDARKMLAECRRVLKPYGKIRISTPDLAFLTDLARTDKSDLQRTYIKWTCHTYIPDALEEHAAFVIGLPFNLGIAGARQAGHRFAYEMGYDFLLQLDADGQHDPSYAMNVLGPVMAGNADLVIGSRFIKESGYKVPFLRHLGIALLAGFVSLLVKNKITDPTSGFHAINRKVIGLYREYYPYEYPEPEEIVLLHRLGCNIAEVPVSMRERERGKSFVTPLISVYYMFEAVLAIMMVFIRKYPSVAEDK